MRRVARVAGGVTLIGAGAVMLVVPGPGIITIVGGLSLLGVPWAKRLTDSLRTRVTKTGRGDKPGSQAAGG